MKYNKRLAAYALVPVLGIAGLLGTSVASAHGLGGFGFGGPSSLTPDEIATRQQTMFAHEASILGLSVDEVKAAWAEGKSMKELMTAKGITQEQVQARMKAEQLTQLKTQLSALVTKGIITQAQADKRLAVMQTQLTKQAEKGRARGMMKHSFGGFRL